MIIRTFHAVRVEKILARLRRKIRRESGPYTSISTEQVLTWIQDEKKRVLYECSIPYIDEQRRKERAARHGRR